MNIILAAKAFTSQAKGYDPTDWLALDKDATVLRIAGAMQEQVLRRLKRRGIVLGLANVFGQKPHTDTAAADGVELEVYSPEHLRSGLFFMSRFTIRAERELEAATLLLDPGWLEGITLNTLVPSPVGEANRDGKIAFDLGRVRAGTEHVFFLHFQVNPTETGRRPQDVELLDGETPLLAIDRTVSIFP